MEIHNYMEDVVQDVLEEMVHTRPDVAKLCKNEQAKFDIVAWTLNRLPSKYVVTERGRVYTKIQELAVQFKADVVREITQAIERVKANPRD